MLPSFTDGDWPEQKMLGWLPPEICQRYGKVESSVLNGPYLMLDVTRSPEILDALERAGFELRFDEELESVRQLRSSNPVRNPRLELMRPDPLDTS